MIVLALDSATTTPAAALWRDGALIIRAGLAGISHARQLPALLSDLMTGEGVGVWDVDRFATVTGPGGFTGLRVGLATIQGLALVTGRPVVSVSRFTALALSADGVPDGALVGVLIDARRGEVFAQRLEHRPRVHAGRGSFAAVDDPRVDTLETVLEAWALDRSPAAIVADPRIARPSDVPAVKWLEAGPSVGHVAALAADADAPTVDPHDLQPLYVRRPDAELVRDRRRAEARTAAEQRSATEP